MSSQSKRIPHALAWVPSSYLAEGIPFAMVIWVAGTMFKDLGHSDSEITLSTASIGIMWSLKPLYAGFLDMFRTKKFWVLSMEFVMAALLGGIALALSLPSYFTVIILLLWLLAFASATQDICVDGVYITSLDKKRQAKWIGWQGAFWNGGRVFGQAFIVFIAAYMQRSMGMAPKAAWAASLSIGMVTLAALGVYHFFMLPTGSITERPKDGKQVIATFLDQWVDFLRKPRIWMMLLFVFLFRSGEGLLLVEGPLFMQAGLDEGGLGMCAGDASVCPHGLDSKAAVDGLISIIVSIAFGILGGMFTAKFGLNTKTLLIMAAFVNVPNLTYVYLSQVASAGTPVSLTTIALLITLEKAGYSFGFVANMLYMMQQISPGKYHMTHYAFCTALMNLVLIPTQMASGPLAELMGYSGFFIFVCVATLPSFITAYLAPFPNKAPGVDAEVGAQAVTEPVGGAGPGGAMRPGNP